MKSPEEVVYEQAQRSLTHQAAAVDELRSRTAVVLAAAGVIASLIGRGAGGESNLGAFGGLAILALGFTSFLCIAVLLPKREDCTFTVDARTLIGEHLEVPGRNDAAS